MTFRWGVFGHGKISHAFRAAVDVIDDAEVVAVAGRDLGRASAYAAKNNIGAAYGSIADLLDAGGIDGVYICTPHTAHFAPAGPCLDAGIPVLVEKPMTPTAADTTRLAEQAASTGVFTMEAMWTWFLPIYTTVRSWIDDGRIGEVQQLSASFGFRAPFDPEHRLFSPDLAGGGVLDVGVYPIGLAQWLFGAAPETIAATGTVGRTGVDEHVVMAARYPGGQLAELSCAVRTTMTNQALIRGTEGHIVIPEFWRSESATLHVGDAEPETVTAPHRASGFEYQTEEVMACVAAGQTESPVMPLRESVRLAETCDEVRRQVGVRYPFETSGP
ncbi:MAG: Gfo/Idh/MocA family oxidoreductase [Acidimicrobiales bacterium]|nr:Gfo/Idh/MocA family oxidoreductase [Acidimicrobiales bacterium]